MELRFEVATADWIPEGMRQRFLEQQRHRVNKAGEFVVASQEHRCVVMCDVDEGYLRLTHAAMTVV